MQTRQVLPLIIFYGIHQPEYEFILHDMVVSSHGTESVTMGMKSNQTASDGFVSAVK